MGISNPGVQDTAPDSPFSHKTGRDQDIDEFRECFYLYARSGQIKTMDELTIIMRSLGMSPPSLSSRPTCEKRVANLLLQISWKSCILIARRNPYPKNYLKHFEGWIPPKKEQYLP